MANNPQESFGISTVIIRTPRNFLGKSKGVPPSVKEQGIS